MSTMDATMRVRKIFTLRLVSSARLVATALTLVLGGAAGVGGCAPASGAGPGASGGAGDPGDPSGDGSTQVTYEKMPDGSIRKTTVTRRMVPASPPPPRPADPYPADPLVRYNVDSVNQYRAKGGLPPLLYDARLSAFATAGSQRLAKDHAPHANFAENAQAQRFGSRSAENQGDPGGVPSLDADPSRNGPKQVDIMLKLMMDEGPGGGHYENMMSSKLRRIGVGLVYVGNRFYMTNDFSD